MLQPVDYASAETVPFIFERAILHRAWQKLYEIQKAKSGHAEVLSWENLSNPK